MGYKVVKIQSSEEYEEALAIRRKVFIEEQGVPPDIEINPMTGENFLLFYESEPVGVGRYKIQGGLAKFERIAILKSMRGKSLGRVLMEEMEADAAKQFPRHLQVMQAQCSAIPFYERLKWIPIGEVFIEAGLDHRWMVKPPKDISNLIIWEDSSPPEVILAFLKSLS